MTTLEKIVKSLKTMPESAQTHVLDDVEYLKSKEERGGSGCQWMQFSLEGEFGSHPPHAASGSEEERMSRRGQGPAR